MFAKLLIDSALNIVLSKLEDKPESKASKLVDFLFSEETQAKLARIFELYLELAEKLDGDAE